MCGCVDVWMCGCVDVWMLCALKLFDYVAQYGTGTGMVWYHAVLLWYGMVVVVVLVLPPSGG
jgi:hypothetical protein